LFTPRFGVFVRLDFSLPEISIRVYQHIHFAFYSSGDRSIWFLAPSHPLTTKKELCRNTMWEHCVTLLYDEEYHTLYRSSCNGWTNIKKHTIG
jgi:hypothetical protein